MARRRRRTVTREIGKKSRYMLANREIICWSRIAGPKPLLVAATLCSALLHHRSTTRRHSIVGHGSVTCVRQSELHHTAVSASVLCGVGHVNTCKLIRVCGTLLSTKAYSPLGGGCGHTRHTYRETRTLAKVKDLYSHTSAPNSGIAHGWSEVGGHRYFVRAAWWCCDDNNNIVWSTWAPPNERKSSRHETLDMVIIENSRIGFYY